MINITKDIHSLTEFKRRSAELIRQTKESGNSLVLTMNGKADVVVLDAERFQYISELAQWAEIMQGISEGLADVDAGRTLPIDVAFSNLRSELGSDDSKESE